MPMTLKQLKDKLSAIEPTDRVYSGISPSEIPVLKRLLQDKKPWVASRAVFALSRISDPKAIAILSKAAVDSRPEVRVAVAASARNLKAKDASKILLKLLADPELGVRKFAVQSVSKAHGAVIYRKLKELETRDPAPPMRAIAKERLRELK